jgi:hypothetical protein
MTRLFLHPDQSTRREGVIEEFTWFAESALTI